MKKLFLFFLFFITPTHSYAYLDPGTGSIILTFLIAIFSGILAFFRTIKYKIMSFFKKSNTKHEIIDKNNEKNDR